MNYPIDKAKQAKIICIDIETHDPGIGAGTGPSVYTGEGKILGVGIAFDSFAEYYDIAHYDTNEETRANNEKFIKDILLLPVPKIGANLLYDLDWLINRAGYIVKGPFHDVQIAEPLIDEYAKSYSLDSLARKYLEEGKRDHGLHKYCQDNFLPVNKKNKVQSWIYKMPSWIVRDYVIGDITQPLEIFKKQCIDLKNQNLIEVYNMEMGLFPLLLKMRKAGVRVDIPYLESQTIKMKHKINVLNKDIVYAAGWPINYNSSKQLAKLFDKLKLNYSLTEKGNPSITADVLTKIDNPIIQNIARVRKYDKALNTFLINSYEKQRINDRIHGYFYPLRTDDNGTVTGRFSGAKPNLQQIPSRDKEIAYICRRVFIPEPGMWWGRIDYSQIEYRVLAHFAMGPGGQEIRKAYNDNPDMDYHQATMDRTGLDRKPAKCLNFGLVYEMGVARAASTYNWSMDYARELYNIYHENMPFIKHTSRQAQRVAEKRGYVHTILGRRARLRDKSESYKMLNRIISGTAADINKMAMLKADEAGLFDILVPHLTVHDELDFSIPKTREGIEATWELKNIMETAIKLKVPVKADPEVGESWAEAQEITKENLLKKL